MENKTVVTYKRRNYFIDRSFQTKFILKFCLLVFIGGLLTIGGLYLLASRSTTVSVVNSRVVVRTTADFILPILIQTVTVVTLILSLAVIIVTLFVSHKIAGPLYRFKKVMKDLEEGNFSSDFHIRHLDQLQELATDFNNAIRRIRQELIQIKSNFMSLKEKIDSLNLDEVVEHKRPVINELKRLSEILHKTIQYFKT
jgi:methyl-accepting chemotaxis protein